ncbi:serine hydrolase [Curvibacter sp. APW13]|uniref:serine hydrolase domain-containing protein n=1 Tax=Curvibacter sp. APW13 TaxID=3077236 RepID=UPI0028DDEE7E|nr:serine hydrolase [Curvibacter sp. APW13]MDT8989984.1 serine hydrolase [Curvibacter sp. APW13]
MGIVLRLLKFVLTGSLALLIVVVGALLYFRIPQNAAGMAAKGVCSAAFVAHRPVAELMAQDVLPASPALAAVSVQVDAGTRSATGRFAGLFARRAVWLPERGCVLDLEPQPNAPQAGVAVDAASVWPAGEAALPANDWGPGVNAKQLQQVADAAFVGAGDPAAANARGLAVVHRGRMLVLRTAPGFGLDTPLHGWSMTKTVTGMLAYKLSKEAGLKLEAPVVAAFPAGREPGWVKAWREDGRKDIAVADLLYMRDGLASTEDYDPWGSVPQMLWSAPDAAAWAADHPPEVAPGQRWRYLSATANLLAAVQRGQFASDAEYWAYPRKALFEPIGAKTAVLETDTAGNWVGSSYLWASVGDWARLGQLMLQDGRWGAGSKAVQVLPPGWLKLASTPSTKTGEGLGYGAQSWLFGNKAFGDCKAYGGVPPDTVAMSGHWGQMVAVVPSRDAVVVRLGWTFRKGQFDDCKLLEDVLSALPAK